MNTKNNNDISTYYLNYLSNKYCEIKKNESCLLKTNTTELFSKCMRENSTLYKANVLFNEASQE